MREYGMQQFEDFSNHDEDNAQKIHLQLVCVFPLLPHKLALFQHSPGSSVVGPSVRQARNIRYIDIER